MRCWRSKDWSDALDASIAAVIDAEDPYLESLAVLGHASATIGSDVARRIYLIFAELQDEYELGRVDEARTAANLRRVASEWAVAKERPDTRASFLDRWQYDVCGYERPKARWWRRSQPSHEGLPGIPRG
ncbi:MAG: hypothetical protein PGN13_05940 [Patulibacter minatonensis]